MDNQPKPGDVSATLTREPPLTPEQANQRLQRAINDFVTAVSDIAKRCEPGMLLLETRIQAAITHAQYEALVDLLTAKGVIVPGELGVSDYRKFTQVAGELRRKLLAMPAPRPTGLFMPPKRG